MSKIVAFTVAFLLLVGSTALGQGAIGAIDQIQDTAIGLNNAVDLMHGHQDGSSQQNLCVDTEQFAEKVCGNWASQRLLGNFVEVGTASGDCAIIGVVQALTAIGSQAQFVGDCVDPKMQGQTLDLGAQQGLVKSGGAGNGNANHVIVLQENQDAVNPGGSLQATTSVVGLQDSNLSGTAGADGAVGSSMNVTTIQSQSAM